MKDHTGDIKQYYCSPDYDPITIMIGFYSPGGGTSGEFAIRWRDIGLAAPVPRLEVYDDGWSALANMPELIAALAEIDGQNATVDKIVELLKSLGYEEWQ